MNVCAGTTKGTCHLGFSPGTCAGLPFADLPFPGLPLLAVLVDEKYSIRCHKKKHGFFALPEHSQNNPWQEEEEEEKDKRHTNKARTLIEKEHSQEGQKSEESKTRA